MCKELPPTIYEHLSSSNLPVSYYYFWCMYMSFSTECATTEYHLYTAFGGVFLIITCVLLIPRIRQFYHHAKTVRDERDTVLLPFSYVAMLIFVCFPLIASLGKFLTLLSPIAVYTVEFSIAITESFAIYSFTTLLIMYLGDANMIHTLSTAAPTKWKGAPPLGCCFRRCIQPSTMQKKDFQRCYAFIIQYCVMLPLFEVGILVQGYAAHDITVTIISVGRVMSVMICFYGLLSILKSAGALLQEHGIHAKFWCIKGLIIFMLLPPLIIAFFGHDIPDTNEIYDEHIMVEAWSAIVSLFLLTGLSYVFLNNFHPEDALAALHCSDNKDYDKIQSKKLLQKSIEIGQSEPDTDDKQSDDEKNVQGQSNIVLTDVEC